MAQSIKISDKEMDLLRKEASLSSRSIAGQVEHWLRIGRAIENSSAFTYQHIRDALSGITSPDQLTAEEQEVYISELSDSMWETTPEQETFYAQRREQGLGVGLDDDDNLEYEQSPK